MGIKLPVTHLEMNLAHIPFARAAYTIQGVNEVEIENVMFNSKTGTRLHGTRKAWKSVRYEVRMLRSDDARQR